MRVSVMLVGALLGGMLVACETEDTSSTPADPGPAAQAPENGVSWERGIGALIAENCVSCHASDGVAPFALDTLDAVKAMGQVSLESMEAGRMPPWQPDDECRTFEEARKLSPDDIAMFREWVEAGMPGEATDDERLDPPSLSTVVAREADAFGRPAEAYLPDATHPDDYRCFELDVDFAVDTFIEGTQVVPDVVPIVHHVLVYVVAPGDLAELRERDAAEDGPGYTCFGGPGVGQSVEPLAGWAPGGLPQFSKEGYARVVPAGSRLVMQVHYNVLAEEPSLDRTGLKLFYHDGPQAFQMRTQPQPFLGLEIPAGDALSRQVKEFPVRDEEVTVVATAPHMHQLGTRIRVDLLREDGSEECLVEIKDWDFNWQQTYRLKEGEELIARRGDRFRVTCEYDNSEMNQPVVNGERLPPRRVVWGDGSLDEMCLNYITVVEPYKAPVARCGELEVCRSECSEPDSFGCLNRCMSADSSCGQCVLTGILGVGGCGRQHCGSQLAGVASCFQGCVSEVVSGGDVALCLEESCPEEYGALDECMTPVLAAGACDESITACIETE